MKRRYVLMCLTAVAACWALVAGVARADLGSGLVAYWPLDNDFNDAWSNLDGTERGSFSIDFEAAQFADGVYLDGEDQYIEITGGDADELDFVNSPMSVSAWFRVDAFDTSWQALIAKGENDGWRLHRRGDEYGLAFTAGEPDTPTSGFDVDDGDLHHVVAVSADDGPNPNGLKRLYIDGELVAEDQTDPIGVPGVNNRVRIGDNPSTGAREWEGVVDDVAIWARALTDDEVAEIWNDGAGTSIGSAIAGTTSVPARFVAGAGRVGENTLTGTRQNEVYGPGGAVGPGLVQEWFSGTNPGNKAGVDAVFETQQPMVPAFKAGHGASWWTGNESGNSPLLDGLVQYPDEVQPPLNNSNNDNYLARLTGEILIPESGTYRFTDGVDDYTYLAIDVDKSGVAGDSPEEVLIDDNDWTSVLRADNNGGGGYGEADFTVNQGGEWLAFEFDMAEAGGDDAGIIYWDYDLNAPEGQRLGAAPGFPEFDTDPIFDVFDAEEMYIPDTHLRSGTPGTLLSADVVAQVSNTKAWEIDVDGDSDTADKIVVANQDPNVFTTILDANGATLRIAGTGTLQVGDSFQIVEADQITGTFNIISADPGQTWTFDPTTGMITLGAGGGTLWAGDADQDFDFDQLDLVKVQIAAKYLTGQPATWGEGDWDAAPGGSPGNPPVGDGFFNQVDIIAALNPGHYLTGPYNALAPGGTEGDGQTSIVYNATTGELGVDAPAGTELTSINIDSASGVFTGAAAENLGGSFDNDSDDNIFKATFGSSFGSLSFGNVAQPGLSQDFVLNDLSAVGSLAGGGDLGNVDLIYIPEPSSLLLLGLGLAGACLVRRRTRS